MLRRSSSSRLILAGLLVAIGGFDSVAGQAADERIVPFTIRVPDAVLTDLKARLARPRFLPPLQDGWTHGTDVTYLKTLVTYWRDKFDWRAQERKLNQFNHFTTTIDGLKIHFIHQKSKHPNAFPLIITHGWPGSFVEFTKVIGPLSDPTAHGGLATDAFDLVIPSIPGYGFSDKPTTTGYDPARIALMQSKLMARLGYQRYGAQGGDWGAIINTQLALIDSAHMAGLHLNMCIGGPPDPNAKPTERELARQKQRVVFGAEETGYQAIQGTKPQTLGFGLNDSPIGLAAWIVEKFRTWCDCGGNPEAIFTKDELLTNITFYWITETAGSSARLYYESRHPTSPVNNKKIEVPTACADFPKEIIAASRSSLESRYNLVRLTEMPKGGHFAAFEQPELFVTDIVTVLHARYAHAHLVIRPARVQGDGAAADVARGVAAVARVPGVDVVIVGRGGGSIEDLWAFNEEVVARAIAACPVPVISAVGHETDFTIADFVADYRAPTPSAAAGAVVSRKDQVCAQVDRQAERLSAAMRARVLRQRGRVHVLTARPGFSGWPGRVAMRGRHVADLLQDLQRAVRGRVGAQARRLDQLQLRLESRDLRRRVAVTRARLAASQQPARRGNGSTPACRTIAPGVSRRRAREPQPAGRARARLRRVLGCGTAHDPARRDGGADRAPRFMSRWRTASCTHSVTGRDEGDETVPGHLPTYPDS